MLNTIKQFFESNLDLTDHANSHGREKSLQITTAALLIELINSDLEITPAEWASVEESLRQTFQLEAHLLEEILHLAKETLKKSTDLFQFTSLINEHYDYQDKFDLLENMWRVAYADGQVDRFEEHLIRKIAGLIYVDHADFIKTKQLARSKLN